MIFDLHTFDVAAVTQKRLVLFWLSAFVFILISRLFLDVRERLEVTLPVQQRRVMVRVVSEASPRYSGMMALRA